MLTSDFVFTSVATLLIQQKKILLGQRFFQNNKDKNFEGWQCPGGYLQKSETIEQAAQRICLQKAGIEIASIRPGPYSNNIFSEQVHTTTLYIIAEAYQVVNQRQFESSENQWHWFALDDLPAPLFLPLQQLFESRKNIFGAS